MPPDNIRFWDTKSSGPTIRPVKGGKDKKERERLLALLKRARKEAGLRQVDVAERLDVPQSYVSKYESGERRLDLLELRAVCEALGISTLSFVKRFERARR